MHASTLRSRAGGTRARVVARPPTRAPTRAVALARASGATGAAAAARERQLQSSRRASPSRRARAAVAVARAKAPGGGFARPDESTSPRAEDELYWDPADLEDEDPPLIEVDDLDLDDDDDDDDDAWFFVPDGAGVDVGDDVLFQIGTEGDDDDDDDFGFATGFTTTTLDGDDDDDDDESDDAATRTRNKSNRARRRRDAVDAAAEDRGSGSKATELLNAAQTKADRKKREDVARMVAMGVPEKLLRRLESEKAAVASFNERKQTEQARKTHKRMTIVAGTYARRKLLSPSGLDTRPMMGMVRGATFDMVMALIGSASNVQFPDPSSRWLDLFAGTGAIGLEAMSRGCVESHFVEMDPWVTNNVLEKNIKSLGLTRSDARVHTSSVEARSIHWSPYDPVRVVNADPYGLFPACLSAHPSLSIPALDAFQLQLTPMNSTPPSLCMERP